MTVASGIQMIDLLSCGGSLAAAELLDYDPAVRPSTTLLTPTTMDAPPSWYRVQTGDLAPRVTANTAPPTGDDEWEDWLRWDPLTETRLETDPDSSPEGNGTIRSSNNDSPLQDLSLSELFGAKAGEPLAPPVILGAQGMGEPWMATTGTESWAFGRGDGAQTQQLQLQDDWSGPSVLSVEGTATDDLDSMFPRCGDHHGPGVVISPGERLEAGSSEMPASATHSTDSNWAPTSTVPKKRAGRKRKPEIEEALREANGDPNASGDEPPMKKTLHNVIEKRYRNNLNDKIIELRNSVPSLRVRDKTGSERSSENLDGLTPAHKLNKATVMAKATEYIRHLEKRNQTMVDEMEALRLRLAAVENAIGQSRDRAAMDNHHPLNDLARQASPPAPTNIAQETTTLHPQQYAQQQSPTLYARQPSSPVDAQNQRPPARRRARGRGVASKLMIGTMAAVMTAESFVGEKQQQDDSSSQTLFAVPTHLFRRGLTSSEPVSTGTVPAFHLLPLLKTLVVVGAVLYLLLPFANFTPKRKRVTHAAVPRLPAAPSLALPLSDRQKAWLTAIQTVWVPKHFLLEVAAVTIKMLTLSLRRLVGTDAFNSLTGQNKDDETARIKAWDIAIDAQLAGGDAEIGHYRLLLTLMESGTLPDSPARLMQKAVHFRVFFWEVANAGYGNILGFKAFTEKVGKIYWDSARRMQKSLADDRSLDAAAADPLPDHLVALLDLECDDVLTDEMIQRAWNLAWNKPSAYGLPFANAHFDSVVEDHAIRSPLDAVAAWHTNVLVDAILAESLRHSSSASDREYCLTLAASLAPPASATLVRALTAKAVVSASDRYANVLAALESIPSSSPRTGVNLVDPAPTVPDVRYALTLAKLTTLVGSAAPHLAPERALAALAALYIPPAAFTLLSAVAAVRLLRTLSRSSYPVAVQKRIEDLAGSLRVWTGTLGGRTGGLDRSECGEVVALCLSVTKRLGGWERDVDSGYGSASVSPCASAEGSPVRKFML